MGNLDSKLNQTHNHQYYSIIEEPKTSNPVISTSNTSVLDTLGFHLNPPSPPLWIVKKVNYQNEGKNSLLFDFNHGKFGQHVSSDKNKPNRHLKLAQNQIKMLKGIRHPNIARYLFAEENTQSNGLVKCVLIVESMRPLTNFTSSGELLSLEQLVSGVHGLTNALAFLHDKAAISHNNVNENSVYLNGKQVWKLSDFELALAFTDLNKENLRQLFEFRHKESLTPEEISEFRLNVNFFSFSFFVKNSIFWHRKCF